MAQQESKKKRKAKGNPDSDSDNSDAVESGVFTKFVDLFTFYDIFVCFKITKAKTQFIVNFRLTPFANKNSLHIFFL